MSPARLLLAALGEWDESAVRAAVGHTREHPALSRAAVGWDAALAARRVDGLAVPLLVAGALWRRGRTGDAAYGDGATVLVGWAAQSLAKGMVRRPRPDVVPLVRTPGTSTPSGHVANVTTVALVLHDAARRAALPRPVRRGLDAALAAVVVVTGIDRVAVGAHRPSDVVAGVALGVAVHATCAGTLRRWRCDGPRTAVR
ncbi:phosphatase PAP2 family protein [Cellulosimicrobium terreum]|nr:phosphatase PAP2 family protein [Cellulosimicrobium terreum]